MVLLQEIDHGLQPEEELGGAEGRVGAVQFGAVRQGDGLQAVGAFAAVVVVFDDDAVDVIVGIGIDQGFEFLQEGGGHGLVAEAQLGQFAFAARIQAFAFDQGEEVRMFGKVLAGLDEEAVEVVAAKGLGHTAVFQGMRAVVEFGGGEVAQVAEAPEFGVCQGFGVAVPDQPAAGEIDRNVDPVGIGQRQILVRREDGSEVLVWPGPDQVGVSGQEFVDAVEDALGFAAEHGHHVPVAAHGAAVGGADFGQVDGEGRRVDGQDDRRLGAGRGMDDRQGGAGDHGDMQLQFLGGVSEAGMRVFGDDDFGRGLAIFSQGDGGGQGGEEGQSGSEQEGGYS